MSFDDSECTANVRDLQRSQRTRGRFLRLLGREGADTRTSGRFYVDVVQSILSFGSKSWVIMPRILWVIIHNGVAQWISGQIPQCYTGQWKLPPHW